MDSKIIDIIALNEKEKAVNLLIMDDLNWKDPKDHIDQIQEKILKYVAYVEEGHFALAYPSVKDYEIIIRVVFQFEPDEEGLMYITEAKNILNDVGFHLEFLNYTEM